MNPCSDLVALAEHAERRIDLLRAYWVAELASDRRLAYVVIEVQNTWSNFARAFLLSMLCAPRRRSGNRVVLGNLTATTPGALLLVATHACKPTSPPPLERRDEPSWHDTGNFLKACTALAPSNLAEIQAALSLQARVFSDLPVFRNFYAHRNEETAARAVGVARRTYLITGVRHPSQALLKPARTRTQPLLADWLDEMKVVLQLICD